MKSKNTFAIIGSAWIILWVVIAIVGSVLRPDSSPNANDQHLEYSLVDPGTTVEFENGETFTYHLGSDRYGRDFLSRIMAGSAVSLSVAGVAVLISLIIGLFLGALAGYKGGRVDAVVSWFFPVSYTHLTLPTKA